MNTNLLKSKMALYGDNNKTLANKMQITETGLSKKINGKTKFNPNEMCFLKKEYNLSNKDFFDIFIET